MALTPPSRAQGLVSTRVERNPVGAYLSSRMATVLRRFLTLCLVATFFVGATVQILPWNAAMADTMGQSDQMAGCTEHQAPPVKHMPNCIDHYGCLTVQALPTSPTLLAVPFQWTSVAYSVGAAPLLGLSIKPGLFPPILAS
jgi:hypothetical protein